ncbi:MAG: GAF domain-containing protein [Anaerolineae bacterium]|nr:GAF domain-containing protein [Anaerolineae bacterium]MDW8068619.1 GAF domain-containing protein [Anaerolineae bacterium]
MNSMGWRDRLREALERWVAVRAMDEEEARLGRLFNILMLISTGIVSAISVVFIGIWVAGLSQLTTVAVGLLFPGFFIPFSLICLALAKRGRVRPIAVVYVGVNLVSIALAALLFGGFRSPAFVLFIWTISVAGIVLSPVSALLMTGTVVVFFFLLLGLEVLGIYAPPVPIPFQVEEIGFISFTLIVLVSTVGLLTYLNMRSLRDTLERLRMTTRELEEQRRSLEDQVAARTADLVRRSAQLEAAAQVAREATALRDPQALLETVVRLIADRFGFYHVGIFLMDERGAYAVLQAASSEGGQRMLARGYRLEVGQVSIVGSVAKTGQPRIVRDVGADAVFLDNPDLPLTRSEMALPLRVGGRTIGVLDVQSEEPEAFTQEDVAVLQTMADQIALAIENARALEQMQRTLQELERVYGEYTREAWRAVRRFRRWVGRRYRRLLPEPAEELPEEAQQALAEGRPVLQPIHEAGDGRVVGTLLAVPMKLRGQVIGALNLRFATPEVMPETVRIVEEIADRLALALENARLLEETRRRAEQERRIGEISQKLTTSVYMERILQIAAEELNQALGGAEVTIQILPG